MNRSLFSMTWLARVLALVFGVFVLSLSGPSRAQSIIKRGNASRSYHVEIEPRGLLSPFPPIGGAAVGLGGGVNFGINVAPKGFLPQVYDSVAITFGIDTVQYFAGDPQPSECADWRGTGDQRICVRTRASGGPALVFFTPVLMQWNFYLTPKWSVFAEPGLAIFFQTAPHENLRIGAIPNFFVGGRYHFSNKASLTMRIGYPYTTVGVSFFL